MRRAASGLIAILVTVASLAAGLAACDQPTTCAGRGQTTALTGIATYAIGDAAGTTFSSAVTIDDYTAACTYDDEELLVVLGGCQLWASLSQGPTPATYYRGFETSPGSPDAWATVEAGQSCDLPLQGGTAAVTGISGTIVFGDSVTDIALSATPASEDAGGSGELSLLQWQFQSLQSP